MSQDPSCRHEYIKIFQRRLKGLERRLVSTRAYLPVGFRVGDLSHLSEGSYCFCTGCRARLFPRRTQAEKAAARLALRAKAEQEARDAEASASDKPEEEKEVDVEELEQESVDMEDIQAEGVKLTDDDGSCEVMDD